MLINFCSYSELVPRITTAWTRHLQSLSVIFYLWAKMPTIQVLHTKSNTNLDPHPVQLKSTAQ